MADYNRQATRDADLMLADELAAISQLISQAQLSAKSGSRQVEAWQNAALQGIQQPYGRERHLMAAAASGANMGTSGFRTAGLNELSRQKVAAEGAVMAQTTDRMLTIAEQLDEALNSAATARTTVARKRTLLIGQLGDKYRTEAEARAIERARLDMDRQRLQMEREQNEWERGQVEAAIDKETSEAERTFMGELRDAALAADAAVIAGQTTHEDAWQSIQSFVAASGRALSPEDIMARYGNVLPRRFTRPLSATPLQTTANAAASGNRGGMFDFLKLGMPGPADATIGSPGFEAYEAGREIGNAYDRYGAVGSARYNPPGTIGTAPLSQLLYAMGYLGGFNPRLSRLWGIGQSAFMK